jgi:hypothetical protein
MDNDRKTQNAFADIVDFMADEDGLWFVAVLFAVPVYIGLVILLDGYVAALVIMVLLGPAMCSLGAGAVFFTAFIFAREEDAPRGERLARVLIAIPGVIAVVGGVGFFILTYRA